MSSTKSFVRSVFCIYFLTSKLIANFICSQKAVSLKVLICCWTQLHMFLLLLMLTKAIDCLIWGMWFFNKNTQAQCSYVLWEEDYLFSKCPSLFQWDCKSSSVCLPEINVSGRIFKTMERHKCWLSAGCTNSKLLKLLRSYFWAVNCPFFITHEHKRSQNL